MSTLSVPLPPDLEKFVISKVKDGYAANKAEVVRRALKRLSEEEAIAAILQSSQEIKDGKILRGDIRDLMRRIK
ncbi:MAG: type II toxin-antitoxin system ParD family antitoxin [Patescibacteria group bacterium]